MLTKAIWRDTVLAERDDTVVVEGYFPRSALHEQYFRPRAQRSTRFWNGRASYFDEVVNGRVSENAAWYYLEPSAAAAEK